MSEEKTHEREIHKAVPTIYYHKTRMNEHDEEIELRVEAETIEKAKKTFKELKEMCK